MTTSQALSKQQTVRFATYEEAKAFHRDLDRQGRYPRLSGNQKRGDYAVTWTVK